MIETHEFLHKFHHIEGTTVGEKTKNLQIFLKTFKDSEGTSSLDEAIEKLESFTYLEDKFKIKVLIHFRRFRELFSIFTGGNEIIIRKLWRQTWFFHELFQQFSCEFIVNDIFNELSYVTRVRYMKNITYFTRDENRINLLFDLILEKYGWCNAKFVLIGCSLEKIISFITERKFNFSKKEIIFLFEFKRAYLEQLLLLNNSDEIFDFHDSNQKALQIISGRDFEFFLKIFEKSSLIKIGKKLTKKLISRNKDLIFQNIQFYRKLHEKTLLKNLKMDFNSFFFQTWPKSIKKFSIHSTLNLLRYYPKTKRFHLIQKGLLEYYGISIFDHPELIIEDILESIEDVESRENLLEIRMKSYRDDFSLFKYYGIKKSIPAIKNRISAADDIFIRKNFIIDLIKSCIINNDSNALLEVLNYFSCRHRNDSESIHSEFLSEIKDCFNLENLNEKHWKYILDLVKFGKIKDENLSCYSEFYLYYIKFLKKSLNDKEIQNILIKVFDDFVKQIGFTLKILNDVPELEKFFIFKFIDELSKNDKIAFDLFKAILDWNKRHPEDFIDFCQYEKIKHAIKSKFQKPSYSSKNFILRLITRKLPCDELFYNEIETIYWENFRENYDADVVIYYLKMKPVVVLKYFDTFIEVILGKYETLNIWRWVKHYDHLGFPKKVVDYLKINKITGSYWMAEGIALATLMNASEYSDLLTVPQVERIDLDNEEESNEYRKCTNLLKFAKYLNDSCILPKIVDCCKGDYKNDSLVPLYYYFYHSPEKLLYHEIEKLSTRSVTIRKHSLKLACSVLSRKLVHDIIKKSVENEKNQSVIEHVTRKTVKYFLIDQSEEFSKLVQNQIELLDISKSEIFKDICNLAKIPEKFQMSFMKLIWNILERFDEQKINVESFKEILIDSLNSQMVKKLSYEFSSDLIRKKFLRFDEKSAHIDKFVLDCLKYSEDKNKILVDVFDIVKNFKKLYLMSENFNIQRKARAKIENFIMYIYNEFSNDQYNDKEMINSFYSNWSQIFSQKEDMKNFIKLFLLNEFTIVRNFDDYCLKISDSFENFVDEFGIVGIIDCFVESICYSLPDHIFGTEDFDEKKFKLAMKLIENDNSINVKLLALQLIPKRIPENDTCKIIFLKIIEMLKKSDNNSVLINLDLFLNNLED